MIQLSTSTLSGWKMLGSRDAGRQYGPIYTTIERALWAFAPVPAILLFLSYPATQQVQEKARADSAKTIAAENAEYCAKWGMSVGTAYFDNCVKDLVAIRARAEQLVRDEIARESDF